MIRFAPLAVAVIVLAGCQAFTNYNQRFYGKEESPYFRVPIDSTLVLNRELTVPVKRKRVFFQYGQPLASHWEVAVYKPWCVLRLDTKKDVAQRIKPDKFAIRKVERENLYQVALAGPIQVAQREPDGTDFTYEVVASVMELYSESQPDVVNLSCTRWGVPQDRYWVTISSIRETLGDIFTLQLATTSAEAAPGIRRKSEGSSY